MESFEKECRNIFENWIKSTKQGICHTDMEVYEALTDWDYKMKRVQLLRERVLKS